VESVLTIHAFGAADDAAQVSIYNEAAAALPNFKPATLDEVRRRNRDPACDSAARFLAVEDGRPVGYATFQINGRVSFPWCRPGHADAAEPLLERVLATMKERGMTRAFAAYRPDWTAQLDFFRHHGFEQRREMAGFVVDLAEMPTPMARPNTAISPCHPEDVSAILAMGRGVLRVGADEVRRHLFDNPYFSSDSLFALRTRAGGTPLAVGILVVGPSYADPRQTDASMPCFRLGAFGTEGLTAKRINGLFSFLVADHRHANPLGLDLMGYAALRLHETTVETLGAQVPSDVQYLLGFYTRYFRRQGSFPILERDL
jgi:hypothetical protein